MTFIYEGGGGYQSTDLTVTVDVNRMPVVGAIVGSSVAPYFTPSAPSAVSARVPPTRPGGLSGSPRPGRNLIAFNLLSMALMAVIPQSTSVAVRRDYAGLTNW